MDFQRAEPRETVASMLDGFRALGRLVLARMGKVR